MTGNDIIKFIKETKLEDVPIQFGPFEKSIEFGTWKLVDGGEHDSMTYTIGCIDSWTEITSEIEVYRHSDDGNHKTFYPTPEEALKIRKAV